MRDTGAMRGAELSADGDGSDCSEPLDLGEGGGGYLNDYGGGRSGGRVRLQVDTGDADISL